MITRERLYRSVSIVMLIVAVAWLVEVAHHVLVLGERPDIDQAIIALLIVVQLGLGLELRRR